MPKKLILSLFLVIFALFVSPTQAFAAVKLYFEPPEVTTVTNTDFTVTIKIDVENQKAFGADAILNIPSGLTIKSVTNGGFFEDFTEARPSGKLELHGFFSSVDESKSGSGDFAKVTFNTSKTSGSDSVSFVCSGSGNDTFILDDEGDNILSCGNLNQLSLIFSSTQPATPTPGTGGSTPGPTNACGGTCGSHSNCNANLFCFQGFCRNPDCSSSISCNCSQTPTPRAATTVRPRSTVRPSATPTPEVVVLAVSTPMPTVIPVRSLAEAEEEIKKAQIEKTNKDRQKFVLIFGAGLVGLALLLYVIKKLSERNRKKIRFVNMGDDSGKPVNPPKPPPPPMPPVEGF